MKKRNLFITMILALSIIWQSMPMVYSDVNIVEIENVSDTVSDNEYTADVAEDEEDTEEVLDIDAEEESGDFSFNAPPNGTISSGRSYGYADHNAAGGENNIDADTYVSFSAKYDPRPKGVSGVRNQYLGSCWAYSVIAAAESNLIKKGLADSSVDLSEFQLIYFMNHKNIDPLGIYTMIPLTQVELMCKCLIMVVSRQQQYPSFLSGPDRYWNLRLRYIVKHFRVAESNMTKMLLTMLYWDRSCVPDQVTGILREQDFVIMI